MAAAHARCTINTEDDDCQVSHRFSFRPSQNASSESATRTRASPPQSNPIVQPTPRFVRLTGVNDRSLEGICEESGTCLGKPQHCRKSKSGRVTIMFCCWDWPKDDTSACWGIADWDFFEHRGQRTLHFKCEGEESFLPPAAGWLSQSSASALPMGHVDQASSELSPSMQCVKELGDGNVSFVASGL